MIFKKVSIISKLIKRNKLMTANFLNINNYTITVSKNEYWLYYSHEKEFNEETGNIKYFCYLTLNNKVMYFKVSSNLYYFACLVK